MRIFVSGILLILLLFVTGCSAASSSTATPQASPVQTPGTTPTLETTPALTGIPTPLPTRALLGEAPTNCSQAAPLATKTLPGDWGGFHGLDAVILTGRAPVWLFDFLGGITSGKGGTLHLNSQGYIALPATKILWEVESSYTDSQPVSIRVSNQQTGELAWWNVDREPTQTLRLTKDIQTYHDSPEPGWLEWGSLLYISQAGCYSMNVDWAGGSWSTVFAAGR